MGALGSLLKGTRAGEKAMKDGEKVGKAAKVADKPRDVVRDSAEVLDAAGDADFKKGGKFDKLKNWSQESQSRRSYNSQLDGQINDRSVSPLDRASSINQTMMNQMNGTANDMDATGIIGGKMGKLAGVMGLTNGLRIVKDGVEAVTSIMHGDIKGAANAAMDMKRGFENNGMNSMVDSVGKLHNNGMIDQVHPDTWARMGQMDDGRLTHRLGFDPSAAANDPSIASRSMNAQFMPGQGVPEGYGQPAQGSSTMGKLAKWGGIAAVGVALAENDGLRHGLEKGAQSMLDGMGVGGMGHPLKSLEDGASGLGEKLAGRASDGLHLPDLGHGALKLGTELATGQSGSQVDQMLAEHQNESKNPYTPTQEEGPTR